MSPLHFNTMGSSDHACNTGLSLGFVSFEDSVNNKKDKWSTSSAVVSFKFDRVLPGLSLGRPSDQGSSSHSNNNNNNTTSDQETDKVSRRRLSSDEEEEDEASPRKKLRLTKDQSAVLEEIFKEHSTLNPKQKQALAKQLNLRPRQVEVWFQNRRARTKLKQTEMDCDLLKKCCERLTQENKRLQKEVHELESLKLVAGAPAFMQVHPAATLSICPSCENGSLINGAPRPRYARDQKPAVFVTKQPMFFPHSSAAC